jgi:hypothetical protein
VRFNAFLLVAMAALSLHCASSSKNEKLSRIQLHIEVNPDGTDRNGPVTVGRASPFAVNVDRTPFLTEGQLKEAAVIETMGGFAIKLVFERKGAWLLEQFSTASKGKRVAVIATWTETRWLGAPRFEGRISDGVFVFTPDATREEAERIVKGLNEAAKRMEKERL